MAPEGVDSPFPSAPNSPGMRSGVIRERNRIPIREVSCIYCHRPITIPGMSGEEGASEKDLESGEEGPSRVSLIWCKSCQREAPYLVR